MTDYVKLLNSPYFSIGSFLFFQQLGKYLNLEEHLLFFRLFYLSAQVSIIGLNYYLIYKIKQKNDQTILKYVEPASQNWDGTEISDQLINITVKDYDVNEVNKSIKQSAIGILMIAFLHFKMGYIQPLLVQSILGFKTFLLTKEARIHIWGSPASGDLRRPFRIDAPFGMVNEKKQPRTDKGAIKKAEKALKAA
ncbi:inorganic phosphate transporter Pho88 [Cokeromyces recurvatus]|uniref:inorganic phosphate transporter Pho88 n=1 Tax=Cokeromyces recurvatus TaxID=90255 RepID=UPI00221EBD5C|nr:inorganic phosphate transporter Pho88 [Cokeromyces recurvatus]KAI7904709.1 inorganic phosphate transporter Pho88 [Cokeromyces recurvatus]